jgi:hypothetical protein
MDFQWLAKWPVTCWAYLFPSLSCPAASPSSKPPGCVAWRLGIHSSSPLGLSLSAACPYLVLRSLPTTQLRPPLPRHSASSPLFPSASAPPPIRSSSKASISHAHTTTDCPAYIFNLNHRDTSSPHLFRFLLLVPHLASRSLRFPHVCSLCVCCHCPKRFFPRSHDWSAYAPGWLGLWAKVNSSSPLSAFWFLLPIRVPPVLIGSYSCLSCTRGDAMLSRVCSASDCAASCAAAARLLKFVEAGR